jgi:hypothetical protein
MANDANRDEVDKGVVERRHADQQAAREEQNEKEGEHGRPFRDLLAGQKKELCEAQKPLRVSFDRTMSGLISP